MNTSFWTELLINKCGCLQFSPEDEKTLIVHKDCSLGKDCKFTSLKEILVQEERPKPLSLITALAMTEIFTEKQIKNICSSVFNFDHLQSFRAYKSFIKNMETNNIKIIKDSENVVSLKNNEFIE